MSRVSAIILSPLVLYSADTVKSTALDSSDQIVNQMLRMNGERSEALSTYTSQRRYTVQNPRFSQSAEVIVAERFTHPDKRAFQVKTENGSPFIRRRVIDKLIEAETDSMKSENRSQTYMTPENYKFEFAGTDSQGGRACYVLNVTPQDSQEILGCAEKFGWIRRSLQSCAWKGSPAQEIHRFGPRRYTSCGSMKSTGISGSRLPSSRTPKW